jgi:phage terminase large subunit
LQIRFEKEIYNDAYYPLLNDRSRYLVLKGGAGSGKSVFAAQKMIYRLLTEENNRFLFVRAVKDTIRNSMYKLFKEMVYRYGIESAFEFKETDMNILVPSTNSEVICIGMNDRERIKSIADPTGTWEEETTELTERDHRQLNLRIRSSKGAYRQSILSFNPIDENHWIRKECFPPVIEDVLDKKGTARMTKIVPIVENGIKKEIPITYTISHSTYETNKFLDSEYKAELEDLKNKDFNYWQIYAKGMWGSIGNLVFNPGWRIENHPSEFEDVVYGMDFGFNHPSTLVRCGTRDSKWYVRELAYMKKMTNSELIEFVINQVKLPEGSLIYADSAEPARIKEWQDNSPYDVRPAVKGKESVKDGIDYIKSLGIYSHKDNHNLNRELKSYKWKEDREGNPIDEPLPINDDCIKATIYGIYSYSKQNSINVGFID